jgi:hypothetical protein
VNGAYFYWSAAAAVSVWVKSDYSFILFLQFRFQAGHHLLERIIWLINSSPDRRGSTGQKGTYFGLIVPHHTFALSTNHLPPLNSTDNSIFGPFSVGQTTDEQG